MDVEIAALHCKRCGHEWFPRQKTVRICPKCKSPYWDVERSKRDAFKRHGNV